jgi:hypothetical protein
LLLPGEHLSLPVLGTVVELHIPAHSSRHTDNSNETVTVSRGLGSLVAPPADLFPTLLPLLESLHILWELVLTAEPLVVLAASPAQCSTTVQALTSIIQPLRFVAPPRPPARSNFLRNHVEISCVFYSLDIF